MSFLCVVMCPDTQTQNRPQLNHKHLQSNKRTLYIKSAVYQDVNKSPLYTDHPSHTSHSSWNRFIHVKGGNTHRLNVESRRQTYGPHPHTTTHQSQYSVHDSLLQLLKTNCILSSSTVFQVWFWCRFCMWSYVQTHRHKTVHGWITNDCDLTRDPCIGSLQTNKMSTRTLPAHHILTHFTLVLESIHTCQGREHSRTVRKNRIKRSDVRSAPTHKSTHQSQYSVHVSLLQLLKTNYIISSSTVFQVRFWCRFCMWSCVHTQT